MKNNLKHPLVGSKKLVVMIALAALLVLLGSYLLLFRSVTSTADSTGAFSYQYPKNWSIEPYTWESCCEATLVEPDWSKQSKPITLHPTEAKDVDITIVEEKYGDYRASYDALKASVKEDNFAKILFDGVREDGHKALFTKVEYLGPPDAKVESFTDHRYYFDNGESFLIVQFREKYHHDWPDDETGPDINNTKYLSDFEQIAKSIKFAR